MESLRIGGIQSRPKEGAGVDDLLWVWYPVQRHGRRPQHLACKLMNSLFERLLLWAKCQTEIRVRNHGRPFLMIQSVSWYGPTWLAIVLLSSTEGEKFWMAVSRHA